MLPIEVYDNKISLDKCDSLVFPTTILIFNLRGAGKVSPSLNFDPPAVQPQLTVILLDCNRAIY